MSLFFFINLKVYYIFANLSLYSLFVNNLNDLLLIVLLSINSVEEPINLNTNEFISFKKNLK